MKQMIIAIDPGFISVNVCIDLVLECERLLGISWNEPENFSGPGFFPISYMTRKVYADLDTNKTKAVIHISSVFIYNN